jgi:hypothetical protein
MEDVSCEIVSEADQNLGNQPGPARLMAGSAPPPCVSMEVFVEGDQIPPMRISIE